MIDQDIIKNSDMGIEKLEVIENVIKQVPVGIFLEIGTREGGTALLALNAPQLDFLISIDPYGSKPYVDMFGSAVFTYNDDMYRRALLRLAQKAVEVNKSVIQLKIPSQEYIGTNFELWTSGSQDNTYDLSYSYVLLDGEHNDKTVQREIDFFSVRMNKGGIILVDNTDWLKLDFTEWEKPREDMTYKIF